MNHILSRGIVLGTVALASALAYPSPTPLYGQAGAHSKPAPVKTESKASLHKKSAIVSKSRVGLFVQNGGQWNTKAVAHAQGPGMDYWVTRDGVVMDFNKPLFSGHQTKRTGHVVDMTFDGGKAATLAYDDKAIVKTDYLMRGAKSALHVGSYGEVRLNDVYPGIDMRNYFDEKRPRYDLVVHPGADPSKVALKFKGQTKLSVDAKGDLVMGTSVGDVKEEGLRAYTVVNGKETPVKAAFRILSDDRVGFDLGAYDHTAKLVIDPLIYGSYFGGDDGRDEVNSVTSTPDGGVYMTGWTESIFFPVVTGAYQLNLSAPRTAFVTLFRGDAYTVLYNSYIGGSVNFTGSQPDDEGRFVQVSPDGTKLWVAGITNDFDFAGSPESSFPLITSNSWMPAVTNTSMPNGWLLEFQIDSLAVLIPYYGTFVGPDPGASEFTMDGFAISPVDGSLLLAGSVIGTVDGADNVNNPIGTGVSNVWLLHLSPTTQTPNGSWQASLGSRYFGGSQNETVSGLATDPDGDFVISGTVPSPLGSTGFNVLNLAQNPDYFETTNVAWPNAQLLRGMDMYAAKVRSDSLMEDYWSGVVGGTQDDFAAGFNEDAGSVFTTYYDGTPFLSNNVATDSNGNVYIVGYSTSFDYPRTSNVIGEQNRQNTTVVTEIATDGSAFIYSTGLNTGGLSFPVGIAVDGAGNASITGIVKAGMIWPTTPSDPEKPTGDSDNGSAQVTPDALLSTYGWYDNSNSGDIPTDCAWLNVINNTATTLLYGSYIGSPGNNTINYPFVDQFGDVWVFGETDTYFGYTVFGYPNPTTVPDPYFVSVDTPMPAGFITPLAFKANPDGPYPAPEPAPGFPPAATNWLQDYTSGIFPYVNPFFPPQPPFGTVSMWESTDGYILRFRISLPVISSVVLSPNPCPGGLGASTTGTVTLSGPAPLQGASVTVTINTGLAAAQFAGDSPYTEVVMIPSGQTQGNFTITTNPVTATTPVQVEADYEGNVLFKTLTVVPWLQQFSVTPTIIPGGDNVSATVTLAAAAPAGGITATVTSSIVTDISGAPASITITVPAGATTATQPITTAVVLSQNTTNLTATVAGVSQTVALTVTPISIAIQSLTLDPSEIGAGGTSTATITMASPAPDSGLYVTVGSSDPNAASVPTTPVYIQPNSLTGTFTVTAGTLANAETVQITAADSESTLTAPLLVDAVTFTLSVSPASVPGGSTSTGTITLAAAPTPNEPLTFTLSAVNADNQPDGNVSFNPPTIQFSTLGPNNGTTATFTITSLKVLSDDAITIEATLGSNTQTSSLGVTAAAISSFTFMNSTIRSLHADKGYVYLDQTVPAAVTINITYGPTGSTSASTYFSQYTTSVSVAAGASVSSQVYVVALRFTRPVSVPIQATLGTEPAVGTTINITR